MASNFCKKEILRILLIGRTGHGKSSTANTISGSKEFESSSGSESYTKTSKLSEVFTFDDRPVEVVDTPGIFDTGNDHRHLKVLKELIRISLITTPGFHVIAFVLRPDRFTPEIQQTLDVFYNWFGRGIEKFACVILTHIGSEEDKDEYLNRGRHEKLSTLLTKCTNRVACFDNNGQNELKSSQRRKFMELVFQMDVDNEGECFNNFTYDLIKDYASEREKVNISKDSMIVLTTVCQNWSHSYHREVLDTLGFDNFNDDMRTANYRPYLSGETRRRRRNIDFNTVCGDVYDPTKYRNNPQTDSDSDNYDYSAENFRREANDNPRLLDRFIAHVQYIYQMARSKVQEASCIVI